MFLSRGKGNMHVHVVRCGLYFVKKFQKKVIRQLKWEKYVFIDEKEEEEEEFCLNNLF